MKAGETALWQKVPRGRLPGSRSAKHHKYRGFSRTMSRDFVAKFRMKFGRKKGTSKIEGPGFFLREVRSREEVF